MIKKTIIFAFLFFFIAIIGASPLRLSAQSSIINPNATGTEVTRPYDTGNYSLSDILAIAIVSSRWVLGIVGSLALLMFIYGGFTFLISAGSSEKIGEARKILIAAVVGLFIVFASFVIIKFVLQSLGMNWNGQVERMKVSSNIILSLK